MIRTGILALTALSIMPMVGFAQEARYSPREFKHQGREYIAVVVGSSECGFSTWSKFMEQIDPMLRAMQKQAEDRGELFSAIGVALDNPETGLNYLSKLAKFDEVSAGSTWLNTGVLHYVWGEGRPEPATPTLVILHREFSDGVESQRSVRPKVLRHIVGADSIIAFVKSGAILPGREDGATPR